VGLFDRLKAGLARTAEQFTRQFEALVEQADAPEQRTRAVAVDTLEGLEELLIMADVGVSATDEIVDAVRSRARRGESLRELVKQEILAIFTRAEQPVPNGQIPHVLLIVGVNGTGKTTTIGKLANQFKESGKRPIICAADTFRAAAVDQLQIWADRAGVDMVRAREGSDPAAVVFDALTASKARSTQRSVKTGWRRHANSPTLPVSMASC
jgi:fused signal recognition particle receptor